MLGLYSIHYEVNYLFITYIVTSKPKRISVAAGLVHIIILLSFNLLNRQRVVFV
jgi:hypothetical protein